MKQPLILKEEIEKIDTTENVLNASNVFFNKVLLDTAKGYQPKESGHLIFVDFKQKRVISKINIDNAKIERKVS